MFYSTKEGVEAANVTDFGFPLLTFIIPLSLIAIPLFMAILMGTSNAVNLTDGLDGLATGVTITVAIAYAVITYLGGGPMLPNTFTFSITPACPSFAS